MPPPGTAFGKYVLIDRIAAGGMAEIFRAKYVAAAGVTKSVVIKRILPHYAGNPAFVSMFTNEAKIAMSLAHGNIAQVFDFGDVDGEYFLAMEHVNGPSLSRIARAARDLGYWVPQPIAAHIVAGVCAGLHYAHSLRDEAGRPLGIVHRDVSPQNVLVSYEGQVKLVDFGIAKIRSAGDKETEHGAMKGKYVYFSPEQARNKPLDGRSDIFATGILLYELIVGRRPFEGKMLEVLSKITKGDFLPPSQLNPDVPEELDRIVLRAMALKADDRYPTAMEMADELRRYLHEADPTFSASDLAHLAHLVCRDELVREGARVEVPREFSEKMQRWRASARPGRVLTAPEALPQRTTTDDRMPTIAGGPGRQRLWKLLGVLALGLLVGAGISLGLLRRTYTLEVRSQPPGAAVALDGAPLGQVTPARVEGLSAARAHQLELTLLGRKPYRQTLAPQRAELLKVDAQLEPLGRAAGAEGEDPPDLPREPVPVAVWPDVKQLTLRPRTHAISIPATAAARVRLDPSRGYRLTLEGKGRARGPGGDRPVAEVVWYAERARDGAEAGLGLLPAGASVSLSGARALYAFALLRPDEAGSGALQVNIVDVRARREGTLAVDLQRHVVVLGDRMPRVIGLEPGAAYSLSLAGRTARGPSRPAPRLLLALAGATSELAGVLQPGAPRTVRGAKGLWLLLPDDDLADNAGELTLSLAPVR